jgi:CRP/FNR family transcriptional regulator, cyclic AMP receptor protein
VQKPLPLSAPPHSDARAFLTLIDAGRSTTDYVKNSDIFVQGAQSESVHYIQSGQVQVTITSEQGKEATVAILEMGHFFGEGCLSGQHNRIASTKALTNCRIITIEKDSMRKALDDQPLFSKFFMNYLLNKTMRIEDDVIDLRFNSSEKRLARLLLLLANYGTAGNPPIVPISLNQGILAEMVGTTRSRVSMFMNKFRALGFIDYNGEIHVHQSLLTAVRAEKDL